MDIVENSVRWETIALSEVWLAVVSVFVLIELFVCVLYTLYRGKKKVSSAMLLFSVLQNL